MSPDALPIGVKIEIVNFTQKISDFEKTKGKKDYPLNLIVHFKLNSSKYFTYMPSMYNNMDIEYVNELNESVKSTAPPTIVYYGKKGRVKTDIRNEIRILTHGEGNEFLQLTLNVMLTCHSNI